MGIVRVRPETGNLQLDFYYMGKRCREQTTMKEDRLNRRRLEALMNTIEANIKSGEFRYRDYFPGSKNLQKIEELENARHQAPSMGAGLPLGFSGSNNLIAKAIDLPPSGVGFVDSPLFEDFARQYQQESEAVWKRSNIKTKQEIADKWLIPTFKGRMISSITKQDILELRSVLAKAPGKKPGTLLSPSRVNHVMTALKQIVDEAADRFNFTTPFTNIKRMKIKKSDVNPFTLDEVNHIIKNCREDFRNYFAVKFFTGMRPAELHGLKWKYVDFDKRLIMVRETIVRDYEETPKTEDSARDIQMTPQVYAALKSQFVQTYKKSKYVFCNSIGSPLTNHNMSKRVWYPMLKSFGLALRNPYQTRHTFATLMLAAGESPEWIANQMGHSTTEMLFKVYSRYVPNLTRRDGSAFEMMLAANGSIQIPQAVSSALPSPLPLQSPLTAVASAAPVNSATPSVPQSDSKLPTSLDSGSKAKKEAQVVSSKVKKLSSLIPQQLERQSYSFGLVTVPSVDQMPHPSTKPTIKNPWAEMFESYQSAQESNPQEEQQ